MRRRSPPPVGPQHYLTRTCARVMAATLCLFPLVFWPTAKNPNLAKPLLLALSLAVMSAIVAYRAGHDTFRKWKPNVMDVCVAVYFAVSALSTLYSGYFDATLGLLRPMLICVGMYLVARFVLTDANSRTTALLGLLVGTIAVSLIGIGQQVGCVPWSKPWWIGSTWFNRTYLAAYLLAVLPAAFWAALFLRGPGRLIGVVAAISGLPVLVFTGARAAWMGLLPEMAVAVAGVLLLSRASARPFIVRVIMLVIALAALSQLVLVRIAPGASVADRFREALSLRHLSNRDRAHYLTAALILARERPLLGWGAGTYPILAPSHVPKSYWRGQSMLVGNAHNEPAQVLCELGIIGLLAFLALPISAASLTYRSLRAADVAMTPMSERALPVALLAGLAGFLAAGLVGISFRVPGEQVVFYVYLALMPPASSALSPRPSLLATQMARLGLCILCLAALAIAGSDLDSARASGHLFRGEALLREQNEPRAAIIEFHKACELTPRSPEALYDLGNACARGLEYKRALEAYRRLETLSPNFAGLHFNEGVVLFLTEDYAASKREFETAYRLDRLPDTRQKLTIVEARLESKQAGNEHEKGK